MTLNRCKLNRVLICAVCFRFKSGCHGWTVINEIGAPEPPMVLVLGIIYLGGLVFGIVNIVGNFGTVFCDQAYWQSSVAAKPLQGVWGFISGGLTWFAIPFTLATTMGLAYLGMSSAQGSPLLTDEDVMKGLAAPLVAQKLLGTTGEYAMLFLILMAVMSTGSAEVIAVASIVIYDVYQTYVCPFKPDLKEGQCILCSKYLRKQDGNEDIELCDCKSTAKCEGCAVRISSLYAERF